MFWWDYRARPWVQEWANTGGCLYTGCNGVPETRCLHFVSSSAPCSLWCISLVMCPRLPAAFPRPPDLRLVIGKCNRHQRVWWWMSKWIQTLKVLRLVLNIKFTRGGHDGVDADMALEVPHIQKGSVKRGLGWAVCWYCIFSRCWSQAKRRLWASVASLVSALMPSRLGKRCYNHGMSLQN